MKNLIIILALLLLCGCDDPEKMKGKFSEGQIVVSVISGQRGQIVRERYGLKEYWVRFYVPMGAEYNANGSFLRGADKIKAAHFVEERMREFELRAVEE